MSRAVVLCCNAAHAPYAFCLADQVARLEPGLPVVVASEDAVEPPAGIPGLETLRVRHNPFRDALPPGRLGKGACLRLLMPGLLRGRFGRLLYLDSDIVVERGGLGRLLALDLRGAPLAAVRDNQQWRTPRRRLAEHKAMGRPASPYLNSGVMLIDVPAWEGADVSGRCLRLLRGRPDALARHDQSLVNLVLDGAWAELSPVWNWQWAGPSRFHAELAGARVYHFIGPVKPWDDRNARLPPRFRRIHVEWAARHGGALDADPEAPAVHPDLGRAFLRHWWRDRATRAFLARFADAWTVLPPARALDAAGPPG